MLSFIILTSAVFLAGAKVFTPQQEADVINFVNHVMRCRHIPGLTIAVVAGSKTWTKGFGVADIQSRRQVDEETLFSIGSLGKAFTVTLLGSVMDNTGYEWNTKLDDIAEVDYEFATDELTRNATLADLLAHRAGLSDSTDYGFIAGYPSQATRDFLSRRLKFIPKTGDFREFFKYNNFMYMLLGDILEKLENDRYEAMIASKLFEPIGMVSTKVSSSYVDVITGNVAKPIIAKEKGGEFEEGNYKIYSMKPLEPAGTIMSNGVDMAKWMRFNLNNGTTEEGEPRINRDLFTQMFQAHSSIIWYSLVLDLRNTTFPVNDLNIAYGFGWFISTYRGYRRFWHSGGLFSYVSYLWLFPDENIGIYTNVNGPGNNHNPGDTLRVIMYYISDILLGEEPWLSPETGCSFPSPWMNITSSFTPIKPDPVFTPPLTDYIGNYGNRIFPDVSITQNDGFLTLDINRIKGKLHPTDSTDRFQLELTEPWEYAIEKVVSENYTLMSPITFARDKDNKTISFDWFMDTWITFEKGVYLLDEEDSQYSTSNGPSTKTTGGPASKTSSYNISLSLLFTSSFIWNYIFHFFY